MRWIIALGLSCGCGLTLDFGPRTSQSTDAGIADADANPVIDPNSCTLGIARVVDIDDFQIGAVDMTLIGAGMYGAHRRATGKADPPVIAERIAGDVRTQVAETNQLSNVDRVVVRGSLGAVLVGSLSAFGLGQGSLNTDTWSAPVDMMSVTAFDVAATGDRMTPWILGTVHAGDGSVSLSRLGSDGTRMGSTTIAGAYRDIALDFDAEALDMHVALVSQAAPFEISYRRRDEDVQQETLTIDTVGAVPLDEGSPTIRIVPAAGDEYVLYANDDRSTIARLAGPAPFMLDSRDVIPGTNAAAAYNTRLPDTIAVAFIREGMLEIELRDRLDVTRRQNHADLRLAATEVAMSAAAHPSALYVALVADGGSGKYAFIDCIP